MMGGMDISSRADFAADPETVYAMLTDEAYLTQLCRDSETEDYDVSVEGDPQAATTRTRRALRAPAAAAKFTGATLDVVEQVIWQPASGDGTRVGDIQITVPNQPVVMKGTMTAAPGGEGTVVVMDGDLKVNIPLLGKKLEEAAAPAILQGFRLQQSVGRRWLSES